MSAARPILAMAADAETLIEPLPGFDALSRGHSGVQGETDCKSNNSLHGTECC